MGTNWKEAAFLHHLALKTGHLKGSNLPPHRLHVPNLGASWVWIVPLIFLSFMSCDILWCMFCIAKGCTAFNGCHVMEMNSCLEFDGDAPRLIHNTICHVWQPFASIIRWYDGIVFGARYDVPCLMVACLYMRVGMVVIKERTTSCGAKHTSRKIRIFLHKESSTSPYMAQMMD